MGQQYRLSRNAELHVQNDSTSIKIADSSGLLYSQSVPINYYDTTTIGSSENPTLVAYGVTKITALAGVNSSALNISLSAPIPGVMKTIILESTAALVGNPNIDLGASVTVAGGTSNANYRYISMSTIGEMQSLTLIGLTTTKWGVIAAESTVGNFGVGDSIRPTTIATS